MCLYLQEMTVHCSSAEGGSGVDVGQSDMRLCITGKGDVPREEEEGVQPCRALRVQGWTWVLWCVFELPTLDASYCGSFCGAVVCSAPWWEGRERPLEEGLRADLGPLSTWIPARSPL